MIYLNTYRPRPVYTSTISLVDFVFPVYSIMVLFGVCVCMYVCASMCACVLREIKYSMILLHEYRWLASFTKRKGLLFKNSKHPIILKTIVQTCECL